jgi:hypothetical protein
MPRLPGRRPSVGQQHGAQVHPGVVQHRAGHVHRVGFGEVDDRGGRGRGVHAVRVPAAATDDHDALVLGRREQHAGCLVAQTGLG